MFCCVVCVVCVGVAVPVPPVLCGVVVVGVALVPPVEVDGVPEAVPPVGVVDVVDVVAVVSVVEVPDDPPLSAFALGGAVSGGVVLGIASDTVVPPQADSPRPLATASTVTAAGTARRIEAA